MNRHILPMLVLVGTLTSGQAMADPFAEGKKSFVNGDKAKAASLWLPLAEKGHTGAQFGMGLLYRSGDGVEPDFAKARDFFRKAAEKDFAAAQYRLGLMYRKTAITPDEYEEARKWMTASAEQGYAKAQFHLGFIFLRGEGVDKNYALAYEWLSKAANNGIKSAENIAQSVLKKIPPAQRQAAPSVELAANEVSVGIGGTVFETDADPCTESRDAAERATSELVFYTAELQACVAKGLLKAECMEENKQTQMAYSDYRTNVIKINKSCTS